MRLFFIFLIACNICIGQQDLNKEIKLVHLSEECKEILLKANPKFKNVIENTIDDPRYHVVSDYVDLEV